MGIRQVMRPFKDLAQDLVCGNLSLKNSQLLFRVVVGAVLVVTGGEKGVMPEGDRIKRVAGPAQSDSLLVHGL
jgi:hypothetical protein